MQLSNTRLTGSVRWYDGEIGFIGRDDGGSDVFVPYRELAHVPSRYLNEGDRVTFVLGRDSPGRPVAAEVELVERAELHEGPPQRRVVGAGHIAAEGPRVGRIRVRRAPEQVPRPIRQEDVFRGGR